MAEIYFKLDGRVCLMNEIFSNQLLQLCLICEIAVKTLYLMANNGREQLMGTGDGYCVPKNLHFKPSRQTLSRSLHILGGPGSLQ